MILCRREYRFLLVLENNRTPRLYRLISCPYKEKKILSFPKKKIILSFFSYSWGFSSPLESISFSSKLSSSLLLGPGGTIGNNCIWWWWLWWGGGWIWWWRWWGWGKRFFLFFFFFSFFFFWRRQWIQSIFIIADETCSTITNFRE